MKLSQQQIQEINDLVKDGIIQVTLVKKFNVSQGTVSYWTNERYRNKRRLKAKEYFNKIPISKKKQIYESRKEYMKNYMRNRYKLDEIFRNKQKERVIKRRKKLLQS
jgi:hypothetical protein